MRGIVSRRKFKRWCSGSLVGFTRLTVMVLYCAVGVDAFMENSVTGFLDTVRHFSWSRPGEVCVLDAQCSWKEDVICASNGRCECQFGVWDGQQCTPSVQFDAEGGENNVDSQLENSYCLPSQVEKNGKCYIRRKPGEACEYSEQCMNIGDIEYYCIANICQEPPECPPGFVAMGVECLPYSVTGGPCIHPSQCLTGSVCIKGKCRGPCDFNQLFLEESCVDYEGAGCIAMSCISSRCPRAFPTCNYIAQKKDYLCCDRSMETKVQCPLPNSEPQIDKSTGSVVECMHRPCMANYRCVFASYGRGKYICCSKPRAGKNREGDLTGEPEDYEENYEQSTTRGPWIPPPPRNVRPSWTPQPAEGQRWTTPWPQNNNWGNNGGNTWNNNNNWNNAAQQGWISSRGGGGQQPWTSNAWTNYGSNAGWNANPGWGNQQWNYQNNAYGNPNGAGQITQRRRRIRPHSLHGTRSSLNRQPGWNRNWSVAQQLSRKQQRRMPITRPFSISNGFRHPGKSLNSSTPEYANETSQSVTEPTVNSLIRPLTSKAVNRVIMTSNTDINAPWPHAIRVLVFWCCTNRFCVYRDQLEEFCRRVVDPHIHTHHVSKSTQQESKSPDYDYIKPPDSNTTRLANRTSSTADPSVNQITPFPIRPD